MTDTKERPLLVLTLRSECHLCNFSSPLTYIQASEVMIRMNQKYHGDRCFEQCFDHTTVENYERWERDLPNRVSAADKDLIRKAWAAYRNENSYWWVRWFAPWK